ncbi:pimeloyl-ACP methyl ester carboxylesterase [Deinococcus metalli]|uniref:Alpha/beta hydrolase n=1 Tax=Deinococcus metalli TaxID=1141878 RepID=A0A7W8NS47_9DEIO|nr:alpha/beta hydrolase [Deinococcus metalli]MBB5376777.1 pimeloyl-ACP methyl ester carboxylesterase [Deinococcus metalli]GHF45274.1 alpha/beta hydrolase [Deinococcus metalli]
MFEYFPKNYVWNLALNLAMEMGAKIGELDEMCRPLLDAARQGDDAGTQAFLASWEVMADKLIAQACQDEERGRLLSAGTKLGRAATYLLTAERMQAFDYAPRQALYAKFQDTFQRGVRLARENCERVEIPYEGDVIAGLYTRAEGVSGRAPLLVQVNGLDSTKEMLYRVGLPAHLARRGVSSLCVDQPGTGEALRLHGLKARVDSEHWASRVVDELETWDDVDPARIGLQGVSLGGYYAPRAVAFEPRFALGAVWGANHNWGEVQLARLNREGERPVPHYWEHVRWVWGARDMDEFMELIPKITLDGVLERVRVPFLVTHGEQDRQIPLKYAHQTYEGLVNSPDRELKIFGDFEGGVQHSSVDNSAYGLDYISDWVAERLGGHVQ